MVNAELSPNCIMLGNPQTIFFLIEAMDGHCVQTLSLSTCADTLEVAFVRWPHLVEQIVDKPDVMDHR